MVDEPHHIIYSFFFKTDKKHIINMKEFFSEETLQRTDYTVEKYK